MATATKRETSWSSPTLPRRWPPPAPLGRGFTIGRNYLGYGDRSASGTPEELLDRTCRTWRDWSARSDYAGFGADLVRHSALVLRGLSFDETGITEPATKKVHRLDLTTGRLVGSVELAAIPNEISGTLSAH